MVDMGGLLTLQGELLLLVLLGALFRRFVFDAQFQKGLTDLVIDLILPCNIIASFLMEISEGLLRQAAVTLAASAAVQAGCWLLAVGMFRRHTPDKRAILQYGTLCSNAGFLGTPVAEGLFGGQGILLTAIYLIPQRIVMWTVGQAFFIRSEKGRLPKKALLNPCLLAVAAGLLLMGLQLPLPAFLSKTIMCLGGCNTGLSMFLIGMLMSDIHLSDFTDPLILYFSAVRLVLIPLLVFVGGRLFQVEALSTQISVILSAMPAGATTALLAEKYNGDTRFAAGCITVSTALSMAAIPLWCAVL